jgi:hypothetical protein
MGAIQSSLPEESDFPVSYRLIDWSGSQSFQQKAINVLNAYFPFGYCILEKGDRNEFMTTYADLSKNLPKETYGQIALMISFSKTSAANSLQFYVSFTVRERRSHTDWRNTITDQTRDAATAFVDLLLVEIKGG